MIQFVNRVRASARFLFLACLSTLVFHATPLLAESELAAGQVQTTKLADLPIRDPFILPVKATKTYYLVKSMGAGVCVYSSTDLENWRGPYPVFRIPADFWTDRGVWAPEMHFYKGKYYLFATFNSDEKLPNQNQEIGSRAQVKRGMQILVADSPLGPFQPFYNRATLPADKMTLDGTLWVEDGVPYMVYCHEWVQIKDGAVELARLKDDLSATVGEPVVLFHASDAPWVVTFQSTGGRITDGPFIHRTKTGKLLMIWSSFSKGGYSVGIAVSESGKLKGPWKQQDTPLFAKNGGHGMIFRKFDGTLMLVLHQPNNSRKERAQIFELEDTGGTIRIRQSR